MTEQEYEATLRRIDALWSAACNETLNVAQQRRWGEWVDAVCEYEEQHFPIPRPSVIAYMRYAIWIWRWWRIWRWLPEALRFAWGKRNA